ncbi:MAG TPA: hypothetical protein VF690_02330 [Hymenobacter sp.]|jgi:uncharacterized protein YfeS
MSTYYFDDKEEGLARETSHPFFVEHASADFYYDCADEFSPFGNDSGADVLVSLAEWYQERRAGEKAATFLRKLIIDWGFDPQYLEHTTQSQLDTLNLHEQYLNNVLDQAVVGVAFGQYKIAGKGDKAIIDMAANAFERQRYVAGLANKPASPWEHYDDCIA